MSDNIVQRNEAFETPKKVRLKSLDALRGFDMFLLSAGGIVIAFRDFFAHSERFSQSAGLMNFINRLAEQFQHVSWEGFRLEDLIMPLFMFMAGVTIPFAMARFKRGTDPNVSKKDLVLRLLRRVLLLWLCGMIVQGSLLEFQWTSHNPGVHLDLFSNTLQAIAIGYLIAVILYFWTDKIFCYILATLALLFGFWACMKWGHCTVDGVTYGNGSYDPNTNLAEIIDRVVLGRWRDNAAIDEAGKVVFDSGYRYTWILSSITFGATTLLGMISGAWIKIRSKSENAALENQKIKGVVTSITTMAIGIAMLVVAWFWVKLPEGSFFYCPLVKIIWTPSMVLWAGGLSIVLLGFFYLIYDALKLPILTTFFVVIGMNSITIYLIDHIFDSFKHESEKLIGGLAPYMGNYYGPFHAIFCFAVVWFILWVMYKKKIFLRL